MHFETFFHPDKIGSKKLQLDRDRTRTCNPQIRSLVPYPLGHTATLGKGLLAGIVIVWFRQPGLQYFQYMFWTNFDVLASAVHILKLERYRED